jgi:uncharacterized protein (DUF2236 family)
MESGSVEAPEGAAGLFGPDSISWFVDREAALLLGGGRALLLQLAHPAVAQGVADHSDYRQNAFRRLNRTLELSLALVFGTASEAKSAATQINRRHQAVRGNGYSALDPELLLWVHATLIDSTITTYETYVGHLARTQWEHYYEEAKRVGALLGIPARRFPARLDDFDRYMARMYQTEVEAGALARELAHHVLRPLPARAFWPLEAVTAGLLPARIRRQYRLAWGLAERSAFELSKRVVPRLIRVLPPRLRLVPPARHAYKRLA